MNWPGFFFQILSELHVPLAEESWEGDAREDDGEDEGDGREDEDNAGNQDVS